MGSQVRIYNVSRSYYMKRNQAVKAVESCACTWVEFGVTVRDLTLAEAIAARNQQASEREPLPQAEIPGIIFRPAPGHEAEAQHERRMAREANVWAWQVSQPE